jgi:Calx-beta domain/FG-GAP-like repeat
MWWPYLLKTSQQEAVVSTRDNRRASETRKGASLRPTVEELEARNTPSISFHPGPTTTFPLQAWNDSVVVAADFNSDGVVDLAASDTWWTGYNVVSVRLGNGDGTFGALATYNGRMGLGSAAADFDGDSKLDIVYTAPSGFMGILRGNGDGTFTPTVTSQFGGPAAVGDFDGDGRPDLVFIDADWDPYANNYSYALQVLRNDGAGGFLASGPYGVGPAPGAVAVGDFNSDGKPDLAIANADHSFVSVLLNDGTGGFQAPVDYATGATRSAVAVGDFNGDGKLDVATAGDNAASVLLGNGDGTFQAAINDATNYPVHCLAVGDFNLDGKPDLALGYGFAQSSIIGEQVLPPEQPGDPWITLYTYQETDSEGVAFLEGQGDGTFVYGAELTIASRTFDYQSDSPYPAPSDTYTSSLAVGDFDGNGALDVAAGTNFNQVAVLINDAPPPTPRLAINNVSLTEGNSGTTNAVFTVSLSAASTVPVTVNYATANGTATGSDYQSASGTLTFAPGETTKTIAVSVIGDHIAEPNETFFVTLSQPTNATITNGRGAGTILDDEPRISISDVAKKEGKRGQATLFTFTVTLSAAYDQAVTMSSRSTDGTATTSDNDYLSQTGTLTFNPGETTKTITIEVKGDSKREANETFYLDLFGNSSNSLFTKNRGLGTILNDD